jgi:prepilin-type N-terminal cleavage/methylation domain-containing protein/prepilin-type processing-associated H-X9-DG protein
MCKRKAFTLIELLVVIAVIAVLMSILMPALHRAREQGKRIACQSNLKQMSLGWIMYAQENDGKIMKGTPGTAPDNCWGDAGSNTGGTEQTRQAALMTGALWPYCANLKLYKCPTGRRGEVLTYSIPDSMNATKQDTPASNKNGSTILFITRLDQMHSPPPSERLVFIDEGFTSTGCVSVHYARSEWWDDAPIRNGDGTNFGFADGHAGYHKWMATETVSYFRPRANSRVTGSKFAPTTLEGKQDLYDFQKLVWGKVGWTIQ